MRSPSLQAILPLIAIALIRLSAQFPNTATIDHASTIAAS